MAVLCHLLFDILWAVRKERVRQHLAEGQPVKQWQTEVIRRQHRKLGDCQGSHCYTHTYTKVLVSCIEFLFLFAHGTRGSPPRGVDPHYNGGEPVPKGLQPAALLQFWNWILALYLYKAPKGQQATRNHKQLTKNQQQPTTTQQRGNKNSHQASACCPCQG